MTAEQKELDKLRAFMRGLADNDQMPQDLTDRITRRLER